MSRQAPIYISDSEEEPIEESFDGVPTSVTESPSVHDRAISDDTYVPPLTHPDTTPVTTHPTTRSQYHIGETSSRPIMRRTARIVIRDFPTGPLAPRDKAPVTEEPPQGRLPHLAWVPGLLRHWRGLEGIPHTFETGESSRTLHSTDEPLELTTLTLVAVARTLFGLHYGTLGRIREIHSDISRLNGDVASMYGRLSTVETHVDVDRESADITRARVAVLERRVRIAGFVVGVCVMIAVLRTAVGLFVPRFY